jgi:hypothetical protein
MSLTRRKRARTMTEAYGNDTGGYGGTTANGDEGAHDLAGHHTTIMREAVKREMRQHAASSTPSPQRACSQEGGSSADTNSSVRVRG